MAKEPSLDNRRKPTAPRPPKDFGLDSAEVQSPTVVKSEQAASTPRAVKSKAPKVFVVQLNTRVAHPYKEMLDELSMERGVSIRSLIEGALSDTYGKPEGLPENSAG